MPIPVVFDSEVYRNFFLVAFKSVRTGRVVCFEKTDDQALDRPYLREMMHNHCLVGFNSRNFDVPLIMLALAGMSNHDLKEATNKIIFGGLRPWEIEAEYGIRIPKLDHIDLIEVAPGKASLKIYNGRLHGSRMQDLPFDENATLTREQMNVVRLYCVNDLDSTAGMFAALEKPLELRSQMGRDYKEDLRSKSDAQIAEAVIKRELERLTGEKPERPKIRPGVAYAYRVPEFIRYRTPDLQAMLDAVREADFRVAHNGRIIMPEALETAKIKLGSSVYRMGIGGLHSSEKCAAHVADETTLLCDRDVTSYYPAIILNLGLYPKHLGREFLHVYRSIVDKRLRAKKEGNKVVAESLKITVNGSFGKLGSPWSALYSPDLMIQVTVTGQLALLFLIERLELAGISVVSANTDGVLIKCLRARERDMLDVIAEWEDDTGFATEETRYSAVYSRDVNNYIAVKEKGGAKGKGAYNNPWSAEGEPDYRGQLMKNSVNTVCLDAVLARITKGVSVEETIRACRDITKFVTIRTVRGGAVKDSAYLGKAIRWYYAAGVGDAIHYKTNGNKVARSDGAKPLMDLPEEFPDDVNYRWYIEEANSILKEIGFKEPSSPYVDLLNFILRAA